MDADGLPIVGPGIDFTNVSPCFGGCPGGQMCVAGGGRLVRPPLRARRPGIPPDLPRSSFREGLPRERGVETPAGRQRTSGKAIVVRLIPAAGGGAHICLADGSTASDTFPLLHSSLSLVPCIAVTLGR